MSPLAAGVLEVVVVSGEEAAAAAAAAEARGEVERAAPAGSSQETELSDVCSLTVTIV